MTKPRQTYLDPPPIDPAQITASADLRYILIDSLKTLLQQTNHTLIIPPKPTLDPETFLNNLKTHPKIYQASLSRQFAGDFPPDIEQTTLKDEPKDWYIKTADFGDECDRVLQHRDGEYTQLLEDLQEYHQILQQGWDRIIVLRPPNYGRYDTLINAAMQCLGYSPSQFQYIIIQPIKLYAFHKPSKQLQAIPDLPPNELMQAISPEALRWYCFSTPLTKVAPINLSTVGQLQSNDTFALVEFIYQRCLTLVQQGKNEGINPSMSWDDLKNLTWESTHAVKLLDLVEATPQVLAESSRELAPHLICSHLESFSQICQPWLEGLSLTHQNFQLLSKMEQTMLDLLKILGIQR
ncbi:DALR anticodon-binding domain-containing protein [Laspinema sp. D1]|uniref:DALR anticodon-binding domain-containing protein n=1 Tax=Laspinema palackyanum TaxID=3231601 RepID=UPI00347F783B|nr:DALR anticodon-binding domain-containing protein [Laspinema sp. D2b]